ncbi:hypothetical protein IHN32_11960 [Deinococcus sp. 14RED07]|uniref:hypothetical protein n=1 Tax=Deinococcus sp. 14RED07 TaxID=2745874 RepID=UPI001E5EA3CF|nr:hypothetical protein [Deinococcus sp. 14RED07]MCD0176656.1 hypothetical protein [Deinococcus sp. 14RED07]
MTPLVIPPGFRVPRGFTLPPEAVARFDQVYVTDVTRNEEYQRVLPLLPALVAEYAAPFLYELDEIKMDAGKPVQFRQRGMHIAHPLTATFDDIERIEGAVNSFKSNGRKGIPGTSHRVSGGKNDSGRLDRITLRFGRLLRGPAEPFRDVILNAKGIGICGKPASGKTTFLRDAILIKGEVEGFAVNVVDTSNEILGEGDEPHPQFTLVRQDKVGAPENLVPVLKEAIRNHGTLFLYADEVGYSPGDVELILQADRFGPSITSSVHGGNLQDVLLNPTLMPMFGIERRSDGSRHIIGHPAFEAFIEVRSRTHFVLHRDLHTSVQRILNGQHPITEHVFTQPIRLQP